jgi:hypothetical protein
MEFQHQEYFHKHYFGRAQRLALLTGGREEITPKIRIPPKPKKRLENAARTRQSSARFVARMSINYSI